MNEPPFRRLKMAAAFVTTAFLWELTPVIAWIGKRLGIGRDRPPPA